MLDISKVDKNFKIETKINKEDIKFFSIDEAPFKIYGVFKEDGKYRRMPEKVAKEVSEGVYSLHSHTAGGRIRFVTDSEYIALNIVYGRISRFSHMPLSGSSGFDIYADNRYTKTIMPPWDVADKHEGICEFTDKKEREITISFPIYTEVKDVYIGLQQNCTIKEAKPYKNSKPVVFYGSSITQGGCASRPGRCYQEILSRKFDCDYINLGFSGSAKAEDVMIDYVKNLDMSVFVFDYDYNAPTTEHLRNTHEKMFKVVRENHPDIPVVMMSRPKHILSEIEEERRGIVETTYKNALSSGDKNVYFLDGKALTVLCKDEGTVDGCHPNDFGFAAMAEAVSEVFSNIEIK